MNICPDLMSSKKFIRLNLCAQKDLDLAIENKNSQAIPILFFPSTESDVKQIISSHIKTALILKESGIDICVIAADEDGFLQNKLSPLHNQNSLSERAKTLLDIFEQVKIILPQTMILLTVEELAPGGLDATDGIAIANKLAELGLENIIATSGTKSFMPLYDRRATQKKASVDHDFYSNEPALASALWLIKYTNLKVWCLSFIDDDNRAVKLAKKLGLAGLIKKTISPNYEI